MQRPRVLFLCTGNACRSQMAEGWLRHFAGDQVEALSAGTKPAGLNPLAVRVMAEAGVDISQQSSDPVDLFLADPPDLVVAVCSSAARDCPVLPAKVAVESWPFPDPAAAEGGAKESALTVFRSVRDGIGKRIESWVRGGFAPLDVRREG